MQYNFVLLATLGMLKVKLKNEKDQGFFSNLSASYHCLLTPQAAASIVDSLHGYWVFSECFWRHQAGRLEFDLRSLLHARGQAPKRF